MYNALILRRLNSRNRRQHPWSITKENLKKYSEEPLTIEEKEKLNKMMTEVSRSFLISLDEPTYSDNSTASFSDTIEDQKLLTPDLFMENKERKKMMQQVVQELPDQEKKVLVLYYFEEMTLREIGLILNVSESRISQIHTKAILRLRSRLKQLNYQ